MAVCLPDDLRSYLKRKGTLSQAQKARLRELVKDSVGRPTDAAELSAMYVRRLIKSGWRSGD